MNTNPQSENEGQFLFLHIVISPNKSIFSHRPGIVLLEHVEAILKTSGLSARKGSVVGRFNNSLYLFGVQDAYKAAEKIWLFISLAGLKPFSNLYRVDAAEQILRRILPSQGGDLKVTELADRVPELKSAWEEMGRRQKTSSEPGR